MTGTCTVCARTFRVRNGVVVFHRQQWAFVGDTVHMQWPQPACPGWGRNPQENS